MAHRQKPATAAWIQRERKRLGLSTRELSDRLALIGAKVGEQTISVWESYADRRPSADNLDALERLFGSTAPERQEPSGDQSQMLAVMRDCAEAMRECASAIQMSVEEQRLERQARAAWEAGFLEALQELARAATQPNGHELAPLANTHRGEPGR